jgi:sec-independent protein translocase protein TatA
MIPGIPSLGGVELLILLAIVLLFFGAKRLPQLARAIGGGVRELREELTGADNEDESTVPSASLGA